MLIPKQNRKVIYESIFNGTYHSRQYVYSKVSKMSNISYLLFSYLLEGVMVAKKDFNSTHETLQVPNLQVIKAMQSLNSRSYIKTRFSWNHYYYTLTDEGIVYLRKYLYLPEEIVPSTHKKPVTTAAPARTGRPGRMA